MVKKIIYIVSLILLFLSGGIIFLWKNQTEQLSKRNYIVVSVQGEVNYLAPLTFELNLTVWEIICNFDLKQSANLAQVYHKTKKDFKKINLTSKIFEDSVFKIGR